MKRSFILMALLGAFSISSYAAHDDWDDQGGGYNASIGHSASDLNRAVQRSSLRWRVKSAVRNFNYAAQNYARCSGHRRYAHILPTHPGHFFMENMSLTGDPTLEAHDDYTGPQTDTFRRPRYGRSCNRDYNHMVSRFHKVDRFLNDTHYDYPHIYRLYVNVRNAIY